MMHIKSSWEERAACRGVDPDVFFPEPGRGGVYRHHDKEAKEYCRRCPVWRECLHAALENREPIGIWGGLNPFERRGIRKLRRQQHEPYESLVRYLEREDSQS